MFGFKLVFVMFLVMGVVGGIGYWYYNDTQERLRILHENNAKLEIAMKTQKQALAQQKADLARVNAEKQALNQEFQKSRQAVDNLRDKFKGVSRLLGERDLGERAVGKPDAIGKVISKGSNNVMRCFEILSGSPLTEKEKNAEKKSEINSMCPDVANPNYLPTP